MAWEVIRFLLLLFLLVYCSLSEEECRSKSRNIGELLKLDCSCGEPDFRLEWFHSPNGTGGTESHVYSGGPNERSYTFTVQNTSLAGRYRCVCESCQTRCLECFNVSVTAPLSITAFSVRPSIARVNDTLIITCNTTGYQPRFEVTKEGNATMVISDLDLNRAGNGVVTAVTAVTAALAHNGTFFCLVHNDYGGYDVARAIIVVYVPPAIVSIQNFTVFNYSVHRTATLECVVNNRSSSDDVRWIRNGTTLEMDQFGKYYFQNTNNAMGHTVATLGVRNLTRSDRGMYLCQAGSKYNTSESAVTVWILEDLTGPVDDGHGIPISVVVIIIIIIFAIVAIFIIIVAVCLWRSRGMRCKGSSNDGPASGQADHPPAELTAIRYHLSPTNGYHNGTDTERDGVRPSPGGATDSSSLGGSSRGHDGDYMSALSQSSDSEIKGISAESAVNLRKRTT